MRGDWRVPAVVSVARLKHYRTTWLRFGIKSVPLIGGGRRIYVECFGHGVWVQFLPTAKPPTKLEARCIAYFVEQGRKPEQAAALVYGVTRG